MNINVVRLVSIGVITGFIVTCKDLQQSHERILILLSFAMTHYPLI